MKKLVITLVVVLGVLIAADFGAAATAEYQVSQHMREQLKLNEDPSVRFNGFPFLYQAAAGDYRDVEVQARAVRVGQLSEVGVEANLLHARVATSEVIAGNANEINVDEVLGRVRLKASDIGRFLNINDLRIAPAPKGALSEPDNTDVGDLGGTPGSPAGNPSDGTVAPGSQVDRTKTTIALDGSVNIAGTQNKVHVIAVMSLLNGQLKIEPRKLDLNNSALGAIPLPKVFEQSVLQQFTTTLDPGIMPFKVTPTAVSAEQGALVVEGSARNVTIGAAGLSTR